MTTTRGISPAVSRARTLALALPGVVLAAMIAVAAYLTSKAVVQIPLNPIMLAVMFGALVSGMTGTPAWIARGLDTLPRFALRIAIVLLGFQISLGDILSVGSAGLFTAVISTVTTLVVTVIAGRILGVERNATLLVAAGTSICGVAAIISVGTAIRASSRDITYAIICVTVFGLLSMVLFPLGGQIMGLDARLFGIWTGAAVHEVAQVVAAGFQHSNAAGEVATITKLSRVLLLAPIVAIISFSIHRERTQHSASIVPWFVAGFLAAVAANSISHIPGKIRGYITLASSALFTFALAAIGLAINSRQLLSGRGKELILGFVATLWITGIALTAIFVVEKW